MTDALFLSGQAGSAQVGDRVTLAGEEGRHAAVVRRIRVDEWVLVADGAGRAIRGPVTRVDKAGVVVEVAAVLTTPPDPHTWLAVQGLAKGDRSGLAVELLTEVGVDQILAWQSQRAVVRWDGKQDKGLDRWRATAREATKQSRRFRVPEIGQISTADLCALPVTLLVLHEDAELDIADVPVPASGPVGVVVGPEGGISPEEMAAFTRAGAIGVRISDGVLRTSTAGAVAVGQVYILGAASE